MQPDLNTLVASLLERGEARLIPFDDRYAITKDGRVFSRANRSYNRKTKFDSWRVLLAKINRHRNNYHQITLGSKGVPKYIHALVLETFVGKRKKGQVTRHLDGNSQNNNLNNLCYGTIKENIHDKIAHGTYQYGEKNHAAKTTAETVKKIRALFSSGMTQKELSIHFNIPPQNIHRIVRRHTWFWLD